MRALPVSALTIAALLAGHAAYAAPYKAPSETAALKPGPNAELVVRHCRACHSADYISTQPPAMAAGFWQAEVTKMIAVFGARIPAEDAGRIVAYLNAAYRDPDR